MKTLLTALFCCLYWQWGGAQDYCKMTNTKTLFTIAILSLSTFLLAQNSGFDLHLGYGNASVYLPEVNADDLLQKDQTNVNVKLHYYRNWLGLETNFGLGNNPFYEDFQKSITAIGGEDYTASNNGWKSAYLTIGPSIRLLDRKLSWTINPSIGLLKGLSPELSLKNTPNSNEIDILAPLGSKIRTTYGVGMTISYQLTNRFGIHLSGQYETTHPFKSGTPFELGSLEGEPVLTPRGLATEILSQESAKIDFSQLAYQVGATFYFGSNNRSANRGTVFSIPIGKGNCFRDCVDEEYQACKDARPNCRKNYRICVGDARRIKRGCKRNASGSRREKRREKKRCRNNFRTAKEQCKIVRRDCKANRTNCKRKDYHDSCRKKC